MKLIYRGNTYNYNPDSALSRPFMPVCTTGPAYHLSYRGLTYRVDPNARPTEVSVLPTTYKLTYRGTAYFVNRTATGEVTIATQPTIPANVEALSLCSNPNAAFENLN